LEKAVAVECSALIVSEHVVYYQSFLLVFIRIY